MFELSDSLANRFTDIGADAVAVPGSIGSRTDTAATLTAVHDAEEPRTVVDGYAFHRSYRTVPTPGTRLIVAHGLGLDESLCSAVPRNTNVCAAASLYPAAQNQPTLLGPQHLRPVESSASIALHLRATWRGPSS